MFHTIILKTMQINYNKYTESELRVILKAARAINYAFGLQFPSHKEQLALLLENPGGDDHVTRSAFDPL